MGRPEACRAEGVPGTTSRRTVGAAREPPLPLRNDDAESQTTTFEDANGQASHSRRPPRCRPQRMSALPRAETAAPRLCELRLLPRPAGPRGQRRIGTPHPPRPPGGGSHATIECGGHFFLAFAPAGPSAFAEATADHRRLGEGGCVLCGVRYV